MLKRTWGLLGSKQYIKVTPSHTILIYTRYSVLFNIPKGVTHPCSDYYHTTCFCHVLKKVWESPFVRSSFLSGGQRWITGLRKTTTGVVHFHSVSHLHTGSANQCPALPPLKTYPGSVTEAAWHRYEDRNSSGRPSAIWLEENVTHELYAQR